MNNHSNALKTWKDAFMASQTETVLSSQSDYESPGKNFKCPFHSEQSGASMKYYPATQTMYCFGKCGKKFNVFDLLALKDGINPDDSAAVWQNVIRPRWVAQSRGEGKAAPEYCVPKPDTIPPPQKSDLTPAQEYTPDTPPPVSLPGFGNPTSIFRYTQSFYVYRMDNAVQADGSRRKEFRPVHWTPQTGWKAGDPHGLLPLYGIDRIRENPRSPVLIVEGENAAEAARLFVNNEYVVVTWAHGAHSVHKTDWKPLFGRRVLIWPDNDEAGMDAAAQMGDMLENAGTDCLLFPPTGEKGSGEDAADFLQTCEGNQLEAYDHFKMLHREFQLSCVKRGHDYVS